MNFVNTDVCSLPANSLAFCPKPILSKDRVLNDSRKKKKEIIRLKNKKDWEKRTENVTQKLTLPTEKCITSLNKMNVELFFCLPGPHFAKNLACVDIESVLFVEISSEEGKNWICNVDVCSTVSVMLHIKHRPEPAQKAAKEVVVKYGNIIYRYNSERS